MSLTENVIFVEYESKGRPRKALIRVDKLIFVDLDYVFDFDLDESTDRHELLLTFEGGTVEYFYDETAVIVLDAILVALGGNNG